MIRFAALALWLTPIWCFEQRCEIGEPVLIERSYLRPSFAICKMQRRDIYYVCQTTPWSAM